MKYTIKSITGTGTLCLDSDSGSSTINIVLNNTVFKEIPIEDLYDFVLDAVANCKNEKSFYSIARRKMEIEVIQKARLLLTLL